MYLYKPRSWSRKYLNKEKVHFNINYFDDKYYLKLHCMIVTLRIQNNLAVHRERTKAGDMFL